MLSDHNHVVKPICLPETLTLTITRTRTLTALANSCIVDRTHLCCNAYLPLQEADIDRTVINSSAWLHQFSANFWWFDLPEQERILKCYSSKTRAFQNPEALDQWDHKMHLFSDRSNNNKKCSLHLDNSINTRSNQSRSIASAFLFTPTELT